MIIKFKNYIFVGDISITYYTTYNKSGSIYIKGSDAKTELYEGDNVEDMYNLLWESIADHCKDGKPAILNMDGIVKSCLYRLEQLSVASPVLEAKIDDTPKRQGSQSSSASFNHPRKQAWYEAGWSAKEVESTPSWWHSPDRPFYHD